MCAVDMVVDMIRPWREEKPFPSEAEKNGKAFLGVKVRKLTGKKNVQNRFLCLDIHSLNSASM